MYESGVLLARADNQSVGAWVLGALAAVLCAAACGGKSDSSESKPNGPELLVEAGSQPAASTAPTATEVETRGAEANDGGAPVTSAGSAVLPTDPLPPPTSAMSSFDASVDPAQSDPAEVTSSPTEPSTDGGVNPVPAERADAGSDGSNPAPDSGSRPTPAFEVEAGALNVPTEFERLPVECTNFVDGEEGRCLLEQTCDGLSNGAVCDATTGELRCDCVFGGASWGLTFSDVQLEEACEASLRICDAPRGPRGTTSCEPAEEHSSDDYCWRYTDCRHEWVVGGARATSSLRPEGITCSLDPETQQWLCDCLVEGDPNATYAFIPSVPVEDTCDSALDLCGKFETLVPEVGAQCELVEGSLALDLCVSQFACQFYAQLDGTRIHTRANITLRCDTSSVTSTCTLDTVGNSTKIASLSPEPNEACAAFTADEMVGLALLAPQ